MGWIQKLFTEDDEAFQVPKAAKPVISLEETLIFDVPNTPFLGCPTSGFRLRVCVRVTSALYQGAISRHSVVSGVKREP